MANKQALGSLAELVIEKMDENQQQQTSQFQELHIEVGQRLTDTQLALERLEFRFKHHARDCQTLAEQLELEQQRVSGLRVQLGQAQLLLDQHRDQQQTFIETIEFAVSNSDSKTQAAVNECSNRIDLFQQRMTAFVKKIEEDSQGEISKSCG